MVSRYQNITIWDFIGTRMMVVVVTTGAIKRAKLQSNRFDDHHHQQTIAQIFYRLDALPVAQPTASEHWRDWNTELANFSSSSSVVRFRCRCFRLRKTHGSCDWTRVCVCTMQAEEACKIERAPRHQSHDDSPHRHRSTRLHYYHRHVSSSRNHRILQRQVSYSCAFVRLW